MRLLYLVGTGSMVLCLSSGTPPPNAAYAQGGAAGARERCQEMARLGWETLARAGNNVAAARQACAALGVRDTSGSQEVEAARRRAIEEQRAREETRKELVRQQQQERIAAKLAADKAKALGLSINIEKEYNRSIVHIYVNEFVSLPSEVGAAIKEIATKGGPNYIANAVVVKWAEKAGILPPIDSRLPAAYRIAAPWIPAPVDVLIRPGMAE